ncbi:MauE/DoxX family redox-associated membrane protein [Dermabacteraceae bacterium P13077]
MILTQVSAVVLALVLLVAAVGKLQDKDADVAREWSQFRVPALFNVRFLRSVHPFVEIAIAIGLVVLPGLVRLPVALAAVLLTLVYLFFVARSYLMPEEVTCACFGSAETTVITLGTVVRNLLLLVLAACAFWGAAVNEPPALWFSNPAAVLAALLAFGTGWFSAVRTPETVKEVTQVQMPYADEVEDDGLLPYVRTFTPPLRVKKTDGTVTDLVELSSKRPQLLLALSPSCTGCMKIGERIPEIRERLPQVDVSFISSLDPNEFLDKRPEWGPHGLQDVDRLVLPTLRVVSVPTAVLLGADGMLAAGPTPGVSGVMDLVADIEAELRGMDIPVVTDGGDRG